MKHPCLAHDIKLVLYNKLTISQFSVAMHIINIFSIGTAHTGLDDRHWEWHSRRDLNGCSTEDQRWHPTSVTDFQGRNNHSLVIDLSDSELEVVTVESCDSLHCWCRRWNAAGNSYQCKRGSFLSDYLFLSEPRTFWIPPALTPSGKVQHSVRSAQCLAHVVIDGVAVATFRKFLKIVPIFWYRGRSFSIIFDVPLQIDCAACCLCLL